MNIRRILTIFDILVIVSLASLAFFSAFSYGNIEVKKTEDYLRYFMLALKVAYYLGLLAMVHMAVSLVYFIMKRMDRLNTGKNGY